jgi:hypothetical protein
VDIKEDSLRHKAACGPQILTVNFIHTALVPRHQIQGYLPQTITLDSPRMDTNFDIIKFLHHQPINVPTAGAQALPMDYTR